MKASIYYLYILKCKDETLYTGITTDISRRVKEHNTSPRAAKYTSLRRPVELMFSKKCMDRSDAIKEELRIKKLPRLKKLEIISGKTTIKKKKTSPVKGLAIKKKSISKK